MYIKLIDPGESYQSFTLELSAKDYISLFKKEVAFGKLLKVFMGLGTIIMENPERLREWISDPRYKEIIRTVESLSEIMEGRTDT